MANPPSITSFSPDSATVGDGITNKSTLTLTGTAAANSAVKVYDGTTLLGNVTANSSGAWNFTTAKLSDGAHSFTAATTVSGGGTGSTPSGFPDASTTGVPAGKVLTDVSGSFTSSYAGQVIDGLKVQGDIIVNNPNVIVKNCEAKSIIVNNGADGTTIQDSDIVGYNKPGATGISIVGADRITVERNDIKGFENGIWLESSNSLIKDNYLHDSIPYDPKTDPHTDGLQIPGGSGVSNNRIVHNNFDLAPHDNPNGDSGANSCITMSGATNIDISDNRLNGGGYSVYFEGATTGSDVTNNVFGGHVFGYVAGTAEAAQTYSGNVTATGASILGGSAPSANAGTSTSATTETSAPLLVKVDTVAPSAPKVVASTSAADLAKTHVEALTGTAEANSTVAVFDGTTKIGTATVNASGAWSFTTKALSVGSHSFTATATDAAGNTSAASSAATVKIADGTTTNPTPTDPTPTDPAPTDPGHSGFDITGLWQATAGGAVKVTGTSDPGHIVKFYDGSIYQGSVKAGSDGSWTFAKSLSNNGVHTLTVKEVDSSGKVVSESSGAAIVGSTKNDTITGTKGNDLFLGKGGDDTFVFAANFGKDVIKDFTATGTHHDTLQFSKSVFDSFASVLSHASQVGEDTVISAGSDTLTLKNVKLSSLDSHDFHFA
ncbi:Ig-like domain-containing protein [Mesorhizobium sp. BAC0120]|uniref:Ig-like domain-containing protein n=1 Tax=Mesorhizobium sp. BAC0120 TaxID=3090670 RepID=UPI00298C1122|nr:Ig-like domain-containing protein [Mesorhizobium sp. BAC0120]MDW6021561.1 Ig-like domain-containing protein [Mesorhizobium sp. BAC0120]